MFLLIHLILVSTMYSLLSIHFISLSIHLSDWEPLLWSVFFSTPSVHIYPLDFPDLFINSSFMQKFFCLFLYFFTGFPNRQLFLHNIMFHSNVSSIIQRVFISRLLFCKIFYVKKYIFLFVIFSTQQLIRF